MAEHLEQGEGGVHRVKSTGSHLDATGEGRHKGGTGSSIPQKGGKIPGNVPTPSDSGSHLDPTVTQGERSSVTGGGGVKGHDRTNPGPKAGDKETQHPNLLKPNLNKKHNYLGG